VLHSPHSNQVLSRGVPLPTSTRFRFDAFELDPASGELRKAGRLLKLQPQPFRVLALLIEHADQLVSREEIQRCLWQDSTFVDFEHGINFSINQIRAALGDSAAKPRYVETLPRRGYRFIAPLKELSNQPAERTAIPPKEEADLSSPEGRRTANRFIAGAVLLFGLVVAGWYLHRPLPALRISEYTQITHDGQAKYLRGTDGSRLFLNKLQSEEIEQVATTGGVVLPAPVDIELPWLEDVSPDGTTFLVASDINGGSTWTEHPLWSVPILGGRRRYLAEGIAATWSRDGELVAYSTKDGDIWLIRNDGTQSRKLASVGGKVDFIRWSPDGRAIRFVKDYKLWEISSDGSNLRQFLPEWPSTLELCCGRWAADGRFFFVSDGQIWVLDERRGLLRSSSRLPVQLTSGPIRWHMPIPGPDGKKIFASGFVPRGELVRYDLKSKTFKLFLSGVSAEYVSFSKDGKFLLYVSYPEGILWKANRDGSGPVQLTEPPIYPRSPKWSPDGSQIAFTAQARNDQNVEAYIVSSQGGRPRRLLSEDPRMETDPDFSSDGRKIAFSTSQETGRDPKSVIRILDLVSHEVTTLPSSIGMFAPHWSPDGRFIFGVAFERSSLKIFDIAAHRWSVLHTGLADFPEWSADSRYIYFMNWQSNPGVFRVPVTGGAPELMVDLKETHYTGYFNRWMGLDPTDAPLMTRDIGSSDIYALTLEQEK
jgi:Tol biopolymer transport system component/DNA-binding winged helix-turn-helix (wHTH) protein